MGGKWYSKQKERVRCIDRRVTYSIFRIFNTCYKTGVKDSEYVSDKDLLPSFAEDVRVPGVYGRIIDSRTLNTRQWQCAIPTMNEGCPVSKPAMDYLMDLERYNTIFACALPIAQEFYILGVDDYNKNPTIHDFTLFDNTRTERWTKNGIIGWSKKEMLMYVQNFCLDRTNYEEGYTGNKFVLGKRRYEMFAMALWSGMQDKRDIYMYGHASGTK